MPKIEVNIKIFCKRCERDLSGISENVGYSESIIIVGNCPVCFHKAKSMGYEEGCNDGRKEGCSDD